MMETKKQFKFYTIYQYEEEQEYLRNMHKSGWKFESVTGLGMYQFTKCEPEDVIYQLDYNQDGLAHKEEYVQMFRDCGWEYLQDYVGYSYFRKSAAMMDGKEETIFCDDASRMQMFERVGKGRLRPLLILFLCVLLPSLCYMIIRGAFVLSLLYGVLIALYLVIFGQFFWQYWRVRNRK